MSATFTSTGDGSWGPAIGLPTSGDWGGATDIVYIDHAVTFGSDFNFGGVSGYTLVIRNGGSFVVTGAFTTNTTTITIEDGGTLTATNGLGANNNSGTFTVNGELNVTGGGVYQVANVWVIGSTGVLNITGDLNNDNSAMDMTVFGTVNVSEDANFHSGSYVVESGGSFTANGTTALIGNANVVNDGAMFFPNATAATKWSGSFDCDGSGDGVVDFGQNIGCAVCTGSTGSGTAGCYNNGTAPLPILLHYFEVSQTNDLLRFNWSTLQEIDNDYFTIEYSYNLSQFNTLIDGIVGAGNSLSPIDYYESHSKLFLYDVVYFRLKQTDFDGVTSVSDIVPIKISKAGNSLLAYPNPVSSVLHVEISNENDTFDATLENSTGTIIEQFVIENGRHQLHVSHIPNGLYLLRVQDLDMAPLKVIIQK